MTFVLHGIFKPISIQYTIVFVLMLSCDITTNKYAVYVNNTMCTVFSAGVNAVLTNTVLFPLCSTYQCQRLETDCIWFMWCFLCRLRSIAAHRDNFVQRPSVCLYVCLSVCLVVTLSWLSPIAMFHSMTLLDGNKFIIFLSVTLFGRHIGWHQNTQYISKLNRT